MMRNTKFIIVEVEAPAEPKEEENNVPGKVEEQEKEEEMDEQLINDNKQDQEVEDEVPVSDF
jgi:hypothetical protein